MAAKAKLILWELKNVKAGLAFAKECCAQLEEENKMLCESYDNSDNPEDDDLDQFLNYGLCPHFELWFKLIRLRGPLRRLPLCLAYASWRLLFTLNKMVNEHLPMPSLLVDAASLLQRSDKNHEICQKKTAKQAVSEANGRAYDDLYWRLSTKEGKKDAYKIARIRERNTRNLNQVKCINNEMDQLLVKGQDIKQRWQRIQESEVKETLKRMKGGKTMGPDGILIEVWKCLGDIAIVWLVKLFNHIFRSNKMPDEWSTLVPIFKNKEDIQRCTNYRGIKLMSHTMKLWERVIEHRRRGMTHITMNQFGFMSRRSTMEAIFLIKHVMERYKEQKKDFHMVFIDMEKAYDKIPRNLMWWPLDKHKVPIKYVTLIKDMYDKVVTRVRTTDGDTNVFPINKGLHQGSALSPICFGDR
ncbi:hypothetical protein ZEAMMB73_Zm00001d054050 [Zea mays]|uniref:Uncharacterized protein n=1 Tax=Zea mays TaxID=4577 RepID=A0A1D6QUS6_MAIZE|nr:hypothetical protein ZEAMMB73_Zm00001d054050 [Zea mays]